VSLLPTFSRPLQLRRILPMACQLGLDRIVLSKAWKLPRDYLLLVEELTISSDVSFLDVVVTGKLGAGGRVGRTKAVTTSGGDEGGPKNGRRRARGCRTWFSRTTGRRRTADDAGRDPTGGRVGGTARVGHVQTIAIPEGVARIEGAEERRPASITLPPPPSTITTVHSFTGDSGLAVITETAYGDCRGRRWRPMTMALNNDGTRELATDDDGQGTRPGGDQRRHSAFIRCNN